MTVNKLERLRKELDHRNQRHQDAQQNLTEAQQSLEAAISKLESDDEQQEADQIVWARAAQSVKLASIRCRGASKRLEQAQRNFDAEELAQATERVAALAPLARRADTFDRIVEHVRVFTMEPPSSGASDELVSADAVARHTARKAIDTELAAQNESILELEQLCSKHGELDFPSGCVPLPQAAIESLAMLLRLEHEEDFNRMRDGVLKALGPISPAQLVNGVPARVIQLSLLDVPRKPKAHFNAAWEFVRSGDEDKALAPYRQTTQRLADPYEERLARAIFQ